MWIEAGFNTEDEMTEFFSGYGCIASRDAFVQEQLEAFARHIDWLSGKRGYLAMTGAMRWPWSQEAPIKVDHTIYV